MELNEVIITKAIVERFMRKLEENLPNGAHLGGKGDFEEKGSKALDRKT